MQKTKQIKVYFIEYKNMIKFLNTKTGGVLVLNKTPENKKQFIKILKSNKYQFINALD